MLTQIRTYFVGDILSSDRSILEKSNAVLMYHIVIFAITLLSIMQVIYVFTGNAFQFIKGIAVIGVFAGALFLMRWQQDYRSIAHTLVTVSMLNVAYNYYLFQGLPFFNGLIIVCNLLIAFHMLGRRYGLFYSMLHFVSGLGYLLLEELFPSLMARSDGPMSISMMENITLYSLIIAMIVYIIFYYHRTYELASSETKKALSSAQKAKENAELVNKMKSNFLADISHEVRTPLNGILGINQLLGMEITDPQLKEYIDIQNQSGQRLLETIDGILSISKLESQEMLFQPKKSNVMTIVREVFEGLRVLAERKQLEYTFHSKAEDASAYVDETMLYQVLNNLIGNAIKFTQQGFVRISLEPEARMNGLIIKVEDSGVGISPEFQEKIYEPFEQEDIGTHRKFEGSGLGLSITKRYVELMGGTLNFESKKGEGTKFIVWLPMIDRN